MLFSSMSRYMIVNNFIISYPKNLKNMDLIYVIEILYECNMSL